MGFDAFLGNPPAISRLRRKLREGRFPHALIFSGPESIGKHTCALMVAKALNCLKDGPDDFCDQCSSCRKINSGVHPDVRSISVENEATQIKIAQIRAVLHMLELQPFEGRNKVFIIDPADWLNAEAANAYVKEGVPGKLVNIDLSDRLTKLAERTTVHQLIRMAEFLRFVESSLKSNVNRQMLTDVLVLTGSNILNGLS